MAPIGSTRSVLYRASSTDLSVPDEENLYAHWDASDESSVTTDGSGNVTDWSDQTDNNHDLTGTSSSYDQNLNGLHGILFDGDLLSLSSINLTQPYELYVVAEYETVSGDPIFRGNDASASAASSQVDSNNGNFRMFGGSSVEDGSSDDSPHIFTQVYDGSEGSLELGEKIYLGDSGTRDTDDNFGVGGDPSVSSIRSNCYAYEILAYPSRDDSRRSDVKDYLHNKWFDGTTQTQQFYSDDHVERAYQVNGGPTAVHVSSRDETYIAWHVGTEAWVSRYDHTDGAWHENVRVGDGGTDDYHGAPSIHVDSDGYVHVFWGGWGSKTDMFHAVSNSQFDLSSWTVRQSDSFSQDNCTYPVVWDDGGTLYVGFRKGDSTPPRPFSYYTSTDNGGTWSSATDLIDFGDPWWINVSSFDKDGTDVHMMFRAYEDQNETNDRQYHVIFDLSDESLRAMDGTSLSVPLGKTEADNNCEVSHVDDISSMEFMSTPKIQLDSSGTPYVTFVARDGSTPYDYRQFFTHWNGSSWQSVTEVADLPDFHQQGCVVVNGSDDVDIHVSETDPNNSGMRQSRYNWNGSSVSHAESILEGSSQDLGPAVPVHYENGDIQMAFGETEPNDRSTPLDAFAWSTNGIVTREWG